MGIGEKSLIAILDYFKNKANQTFLSKILQIIKLENLKVKTKSILNNKIFVITGSLSRPRPDIQAEIELLGGKVSSSVSSKTDYLVLGENEDGKVSSKETMARKLNVPIINESQLIKLLK